MSFVMAFGFILLGYGPFIRLILGKVGVDGFTRPRWKSDITYEFHLKVVFFSVRLMLPKVGIDGFTRLRRESNAR